MGTSGASAQPQPARVLVDTNVVLDQLLQREPWYTQAQPFWQARDARQLVAYLPASVLTDIYYIARRQIGNDPARQAVVRCLREFGLLAVYRRVLEAAMALPGTDVEDNVQIVCAQLAHLDLIVTRDATGFQLSPVPVLNPMDINGWLAARK